MTPTHQPTITIYLNGEALVVTAGANLAAVLLAAQHASRMSVTQQARAAFCGMGLCGECRITINGEAMQLACRTECVEGMKVSTHAG